MKKACGLQLLIWLALFAGYVAAFRPYIEEIPPLLIVGFLGSLFAMLFLGSLTTVYTSARDAAALSRAARGVPPRDGRLEAASGAITSESAPVLSPFQGLPCVAYEYDVKAHGKSGASEWAGMGLIPSVIRTSTGSMRLLGYPLLDAFVETKIGKGDLQRAEEYLRTAPFTEASGTGTIGSLMEALGDALVDDDGSVRKDLRLGGAGRSLEGKRATEKVVKLEAPVTALGIYSAAKGGLVPRSGFSFQPVRLCPGDIGNARELFVRKARKSAIAGTVLFLVLHTILALAWFASRAS